jgi:predicted NBD/HSP70 family sugar kinase
VTQISPAGRQLRPQGKVLQEDARRHHRALILQQLFSHGPASRADLARATALTRVTVSDLVGSMIKDELLEELGAPAPNPAQGRVGKPPTMVGFVPEAAHVVCLDLSVEDTMTGAVINLAGTVLTRRSVDTGGATGPDALTLVHRLAADLVAAATRPVLGIGVGTPGVVDADGTVLDAPNLGWEDVHLARSLNEALGLPVFVANDANTAALAEHTFGHAGEGGLMLVRVGKGVGAGLILGGQLLHGHRSAAGEIGHVVIDPAGTTCACGRVGCLETVLGVPRLRQRLEHDGPDALGRVGELLGTVLAPVVGTLNLHELVLSGPTDLLDGPLREAVATTIRRNTMAVSGDHLVVRTSTLGDDVVLVGAAALVLAGELGVS